MQSWQNGNLVERALSEAELVLIIQQWAGF